VRTLLLAAALVAAVSIATSAKAESCQSVIANLCPNKNARCLVRDNPDFYKDEDPALYKRITECDPVRKKKEK